MDLFLGIDFGTSGARAIAIDAMGKIQAQISRRFATTDAAAGQWRDTLWELLTLIPIEVRSRLGRIAINGTSSTVLLCDKTGVPLVEPLLYNDDRGASVLGTIRQIAPPQHTVVSATSSLAKLLWWQQNCDKFSQAVYFLHQADWLASLLHGELGISDYHNCLKLGYDVEDFCYPEWLPLQRLLPKVVVPGTAIAPIQLGIALEFDLPSDCQVCAGTTDSIAAFIASRANASGDAVTSLGSTLVLKLLSDTRVEDGRYGVYSHRFGDRWLVGGASNTGGAVLKHFFTEAELVELSSQIPAHLESPLQYYPLLAPGERFPINDSSLSPNLDPQPSDRVEFLHGLLEGMARIEARGYHLLKCLGATPLKRVFTSGGGASNFAWNVIRSRQLSVPVKAADETEAAYGTALLAMKGLCEGE